MRHKGIILVSTIMVFVLATVVSFVWLFKIRYVDVSVVAGSVDRESTYEYVNGVLEENFSGQSYFSVKENDVLAQLTKNPYVKVTKVKKVFPDRIEVAVSKRVERFALVINETNYYVTDSEYVLLKRETDASLINEDIIKMSLKDISLDESTVKEGNVIGYENAELVGYMTSIFNGFSDGINLIKDVEVLGRENRIKFNTKTGVIIEFRFASSDPNASSETKRQEALALVGKVEEVEEFYLDLTEKEQRSGAVLILTKKTGEIAIEYTSVVD